MSTHGLPRSTPSAQGVSAAGIEAFLDALAAQPQIEMHSLMIVRHGAVVAEGWWTPYSKDRVHLLYSLSKSFTSTAAGFAVAAGRIDLDDEVLSYFPEFDADITDERSRSIKIRHVAAMASGHAAETLDEAVRLDPAELIRGFLMIPPDAEPGTLFAYNQPCTYSLGAIVQRVSGQTLIEYLTPRLFHPLGIEEAYWFEQPAGRNLGFSGLHATTETIAKLGQLYLNRGEWQGEQLLPGSWVDEATRSHVDNPGESNPDWSQGYGFQFWQARHGYRGDGAYGQFMVILPGHDVVIATTACTEDMQAVLDAAWTHLLPAFADHADDPEADAALAQRLTQLAIAPRPGAEPSDASLWTDLALAPTESTRQAFPTLTDLQVTREGGDWQIALVEAGGTRIAAPLGIGEWRVTADHAAVPVATSGGWTGHGASERLEFGVMFIETPHTLGLSVDLASGTFDAVWNTTPLHPGPLRDLAAPR